ncbi:MAG: diguanylate cyclase [Candidatus Scalindua sp.]|nr:diguanylate cyclase [Candidatus Scalindua sp.]
MDHNLQIDYENVTGSPFTDSLTGLFNHGFFQIMLENEIKRVKRYGTTFTLALIDVDSFARFNKLKGTLNGDRKLKEIAQKIKENIRDVDLASRYLGDVFALILIKSEAAQSLVASERIMQAMKKLPDGDNITLSIGLASCPEDATDKESLIKKTEEALLQAKIMGKNRAHFFEKQKHSMEEQKPRILIVDDEPRNLKVLEALLLPLNYEVIKASNGEDVFSLVVKVDVDLILLDVMMPGMDGYEVCRRLKSSENTRLIPVVMLTALTDKEAKIKGIDAGADDFISKPPEKIELITRIKTLIKMKALNNNLTSLESVLYSLANAVEAKDEYTKGHIWRVSQISEALGKKLGLSERSIRKIKFGGIIHDIGKIGIPNEILNKPGPLDYKEFEIMKEHPTIGYRICEPLKKTLGMSLDIILYHHEKLDGSGYPEGLRDEFIPIGAKIMAVVDIYDALVTDRPYRKRMTKEKAQDILRQQAVQGKLDKQIVEYLIEMTD